MLCRYPMLHTALFCVIQLFNLGCKLFVRCFLFCIFCFPSSSSLRLLRLHVCAEKDPKKKQREVAALVVQWMCLSRHGPACVRELLCYNVQEILTRKQQKVFHSTPRHRRQRLACASAILHLIAYSPVVQIHREIFHKRIFLLDSAIVVAQSRSVRSRSSLFELNTYCTSLLSSCAVVEMSDLYIPNFTFHHQKRAHCQSILKRWGNPLTEKWSDESEAEMRKSPELLDTYSYSLVCLCKRQQHRLRTLRAQVRAAQRQLCEKGRGAWRIEDWMFHFRISQNISSPLMCVNRSFLFNLLLISSSHNFLFTINDYGGEWVERAQKERKKESRTDSWGTDNWIEAKVGKEWIHWSVLKEPSNMFIGIKWNKTDAWT